MKELRLTAKEYNKGCIWVRYNRSWRTLDKYDDRQKKTSHIYDEAEALQIYNKIKNSHIRYFESLKCKFKELLLVKWTCIAVAGQQLYRVLFTMLKQIARGLWGCRSFRTSKGCAAYTKKSYWRIQSMKLRGGIGYAECWI